MRPGVVRVLFVLFSLLTGLGLLAYGLGWLLLPHQDGRIHAEQVLHGVVTGGFVGSVLLILMGSDPFAGGGWDESGHWHQHGVGVLPLVVVGLVIWWVVRRRHAHHG
jgi:hypothetical protein